LHQRKSILQKTERNSSSSSSPKKKAFMQTRWLHGVNNAILTTVKKGEAP
jgi:hypothetical protein